MYRLQVRPEVQKIVEKLAKKDKKQVEIIFCKVNEVLQDPHRYKNLRSPLNHWKRVHIDSHFVLIFSVDEKEKIVILEYYGHHDDVY
ncbi:type II toxin-antitoxin system RelE family toxin [Methanosarcina sp.]|uniref:type II toxin-antitoxin system RelE family toxin n=1 Tax=Methanosarcina sp. TaxID=2213 RepID=UPI002ABAF9DC|nr:type II toxin-antitoxin system RelE/ParE family toxin [Methanosarcina sp.]MDY9928160.1 type II toxin-antitoxin system RelE/ParE family toxin [Methanosarcina sp.]